MKYGIIEEKDLSESHRKILRDGRIWGQEWLTGFFQSLNADPDRDDEYRKVKLLQISSSDDDLSDFVFAVGNRICAVLIDVYFVKGMGFDKLHFLTYERRMRLIEASLEHRFCPMIVNVRWKLDAEKGRYTYETTENWMSDIVSGEQTFPEGGMTKALIPVGNWEAHVRAVNAAADELKSRGYGIHWMAYDLNRKPDLWITDREGNGVWVLVSYHHRGDQESPDYSYFDYKAKEFADKRGIGVDVALYNEGGEEEHGDSVVYRGPNVKAEVVAVSELYSPKTKKEKMADLIAKIRKQLETMPEGYPKMVAEKKLKFYQKMYDKMD